MQEFFTASLREVSQRLACGDLSSRELTTAMLARIETLDPQLHSYATVTPALALEAAARADSDRATGIHRGPLQGIPLGMKDIIAAAGAPTHAGSVALRNWNPGCESTLARRLREGGAVLLGKHQTTEAACGDHHPTIAPPVNPFNPGAWTGVSSSGSAVATAAGLSFGSFGSDTGGSIRFPSHCCGLVGLKPTWGRISRYGVFPLAESFDHVGPLARTVEDVAMLYEGVAGRDELDPTSLDEPVAPWSPQQSGRLALRIGFDEAYCNEGLHEPIARSLVDGCEVLRAAGATIVPVEIPRLGEAVSDWLSLCAAQAVEAHAATYPERAADYGPALTALLEFGRGIEPGVITLATESRQRFAASYAALFEHIDVFLSPTFYGMTPTVEEAARQMRGAGLRRFVAFTAPANLCGCPTLSLPGGLDESGTPFGYQLVGRALGEHALFSAGDAIEQSAQWPKSPVLIGAL